MLGVIGLIISSLTAPYDKSTRDVLAANKSVLWELFEICILVFVALLSVD